jgi:hypothetical protein
MYDPFGLVITTLVVIVVTTLVATWIEAMSDG